MCVQMSGIMDRSHLFILFGGRFLLMFRVLLLPVFSGIIHRLSISPVTDFSVQQRKKSVPCHIRGRLDFIYPRIISFQIKGGCNMKITFGFEPFGVSGHIQVYFKINLYMSRHPEWLKPKGYLHITPSLDLKGNDTKWVSKIQSPPYVARYAFFPLLYREIRHRRYRKPVDYSGKNRKKQHSKHQKKPPTKKNEKVRPIHYATHLDAHIFSYYAHILNERYIKRSEERRVGRE